MKKKLAKHIYVKDAQQVSWDKRIILQASLVNKRGKEKEQEVVLHLDNINEAGRKNLMVDPQPQQEAQQEDGELQVTIQAITHLMSVDQDKIRQAAEKVQVNALNGTGADILASLGKKTKKKK